MSKKNKISASHILVMHQESQNSRSELTSEEAKKKIDDIYKEIKSGSIKFADAAVKHSNCPSGCLLYTSPSPRDRSSSRMPSSA